MSPLLLATPVKRAHWDTTRQPPLPRGTPLLLKKLWVHTCWYECCLKEFKDRDNLRINLLIFPGWQGLWCLCKEWHRDERLVPGCPHRGLHLWQWPRQMVQGCLIPKSQISRSWQVIEIICNELYYHQSSKINYKTTNSIALCLKFFYPDLHCSDFLNPVSKLAASGWSKGGITKLHYLRWSHDRSLT